MAAEYRFETIVRSAGGRRGIAQGDAAAPRIAFGPPPEFQGEAGAWTPEHFFLAAIASCFLVTFAGIAESSRFVYVGIELSAEGIIQKTEGGLQFTEVILRPTLTIAREEERERALRLLEKAERSCLVSRSVQSAVRMESLVQVNAVGAAA
jgi:peroxiredoxin-like protein